MANDPRSPSQSFHNIRCVPKRTSSIRDVCKAYKSLITRCHSNQNQSPKGPKEDAKRKVINLDYEASKDRKQHQQEEEAMNGVHNFRYNSSEPTTPRGFYNKNRSVDGCFGGRTSPFSRCASRGNGRRSTTPTPATAVQAAFLKSKSRGSGDGGGAGSISRNASRRSTTPIMFSNSSGLMKPPAIVKKLECTLEELCFGCVKKIKITRNVATRTGQIIEEEELLTIKVKPGWKQGTKITFEGMGDERPGTYPADITFLIAEKRHPLFRREGDDLELVIEIPLLEALTGCNFSIPLLGGETMSLAIDEIIHPGYEKNIAGQGMPNSKEQGRRGNLRILFLIEFPTRLTDEQRSDAFGILQYSC